MTYMSTLDTERPPFPRGAILRVWVAPRRTVRAIIDSDSRRGAWFIAAFLAIGRFDPGASPTATSLFGALLFSLVAGIPSWLVASVVLSWVGQKLGGQGDLEDLKAGVAWGSVPLIAAQILAIASTLVPSGAGSCALGVLLLVAFGWGLVVYVRAVSEAHSVSTVRGLAILLICCVPALFLAGLGLVARGIG